jgi:antitoxin MazE
MTTLTAIGNSQGIRIPKPLIKQAQLENKELELIVMDKGLLIQPVIKQNRSTWSQNIEQVLLNNKNKEDTAILDDLLNDNDLETWEW